ncbi:unnamed protein product [Pleuronectes platessa]|uniref:Uncharacterized protein n=1 Tax=Pleuronectes platessa TaxID=8262 RepID=A0A9N7UK16_PLEPL|nr:unnamed protein product [Pleuronectes platessa]
MTAREEDVEGKWKKGARAVLAAGEDAMRQRKAPALSETLASHRASSSAGDEFNKEQGRFVFRCTEDKLQDNHTFWTRLDFLNKHLNSANRNRLVSLGRWRHAAVKPNDWFAVASEL